MMTAKFPDLDSPQDEAPSPDAFPENGAARQYHARLVMTDGRRYCALTGEGAIWVVPAAGCLLQPTVGDIALVSVSGAGTGYVLSVLERAKPEQDAVVAMQGTLRLQADKVALDGRESVDIAAGAQLAMRADSACMQYGTLSMEGTSLHARWTQHVQVTKQRIDISDKAESHYGYSIRHIATHEEVTAVSFRQLVTRDWNVRAAAAVLIGSDRVAIDGDAVQIG